MILFLPASVIAIPLVPVLLGLPRHCRCARIPHLEPIGRAPGAVIGVLALRHYTFEAELAGVATGAMARARGSGTEGGELTRCAERGRTASTSGPPGSGGLLTVATP